MNEAETRAEHIDPALKEAGWASSKAAAFIGNISSHPGVSKDMDFARNPKSRITF